VNDELEEVLRKFGLRRYESAIYLSLMTLGNATAVELSRRASVPLPRIYTTIKSLERRGYLHRLPGTPSRFQAANPGLILRAEMALLRKNLESVLLDAEQEYETASSKQPMPEPMTMLTYGERGMLASTIGMFASAQSELLGVFEDISWCTDEHVLKTMKEVKNRGVKVRVVGRKSPELSEDFEILRAASGANVRLVNPTELKPSFMVRDGAHVLIVTTARSELGPGQVSTVVVTEPNLSRLFQTAFETIWNRASSGEF